MNIIVAGGGRVGFHLARLLAGDRQTVTVIERGQHRLEQIQLALDVSTVQGDGSDALLLQTIGAGACDLFVASMGDDEANLIGAATAKGLGAKRVVARVDNPKYLASNVLYETILGIDFIMSPDALAAREITQFIVQPGVLAADIFGRGRVHMRRIAAERTPTVDGKTLKDVLPPGRGALVGLIERRGEIVVPRGDTVVQVGDVVTLAGLKEKLGAVQGLFVEEEARARRVVVMGGSTIGMQVARSLEGKMKSVKLFERKEDRANALAAQLAKTHVIHRDATSREALEQERVDDVDVFVAATNDDERNIMACVLAKEVGAGSVVCIVQQPDFAPLLARLGIDLAVTPRACIANGILKLAHEGEQTALLVLAEGQAEIIEFTVGADSPLAGRTLRELSPKLPRQSLIAALTRGDKAIVPSGNDDLRPGDAVVVIAAADAVEAVRKLMGKRA